MFEMFHVRFTVFAQLGFDIYIEPDRLIWSFCDNLKVLADKFQHL